MQLLRAGEQALERGDAAGATTLFEQAGFVRHAADAELGLIRAYMQAGEYRRALAFAAHTAGAHPDVPAGAGMYAWLLHLGGQVQIAARTLDRARERLRADTVLQAADALLKAQSEAPRGVLLEAPGRLAPFSAEAPEIAARVFASGVLIDRGRRVLAPAASLSASRLWVRDGLGRMSAARIVRTFNDIDLAELEVTTPFAHDVDPVASPARDPFPGSPGYAIEYPRAADAAPAWPLLRVGFLGAPAALPGVYALGIDMPPGTRGGPVFDRSGRLIGVTTSAEVDGMRRDRIVLASVLRARVDAAEFRNTDDRVAPRPMDEIYERALRTTVQVIAAH